MMSKYKVTLKAVLSIAVAVVLLLLAALPVNTLDVRAEEQNQDKQYVIDEAEILTDAQVEKLEKLCKEKSEKCKTDIVILTVNNKLDYSALDQYMLNILTTKYGYNGTGTDCDAVGYVINVNQSIRADRLVVTAGISQDQISNDQMDSVRKSAEKKLKNNDYYAGCVKYVNGMELRLNRNFFFQCMTYLPIKLLIAAAVAIIAVLIMMFNAKAKMTVSGNTYAKGHHGELLGQSDHFINTTVVRRQIQTNHGGGGGGGGGGARSSGGHF